MQNIKTTVLFVCLCVLANIKAQICTNETPVSFDSKSKLTIISKSLAPVVTTPKLDMAKIAKEDLEDEEYDMPPRFGYSHKVNYDLNNSGTWYKLPNGDKLWQLEVVCPAAVSVNFCYDKFWIPEGGKFFVYSKDRKHTIGAFTSINNKGDRDNIQGFATGLVYGDDVVLEYYQPKEITTDAIISIEYMVHGYRYIRIDEIGYGASDPCTINVNCEEGQDWLFEKRSVALIIVNGERWCTGSLINTSDLSHKPYLLTADHCLGGNANAPVKYDAVNSPNLNHFTFYWNYEVPGCDNTNLEPGHVSTNGATVISNPYGVTGEKSDFALLRLTEDPITLSNYSPYYLGWDRSGSSGDPGVCIHHPRGDVKKISTVLSQPASSTYSQYHSVPSYWKVYWKNTQNGHGIVMHGSSGSPLLNAMHRVIGQLRWIETEDCNDNGYALYGKFDASWTGNNIDTDSIHRRLDCWLDSLNTGVQTMGGLIVIHSSMLISTSLQLYSNIRIKSTGQLILEDDVELKGNGIVMVDSGGTLIIDGCTLSIADIVLKPGASLEILNGGILETRDGFKAPMGVDIYIDDGQIL